MRLRLRFPKRPDFLNRRARLIKVTHDQRQFWFQLFNSLVRFSVYTVWPWVLSMKNFKLPRTWALKNIFKQQNSTLQLTGLTWQRSSVNIRAKQLLPNDVIYFAWKLLAGNSSIATCHVSSKSQWERARRLSGKTFVESRLTLNQD